MAKTPMVRGRSAVPTSEGHSRPDRVLPHGGEIPVRMGSARTRRCPPTLASLHPRRATLKRATVFLLGFFLLCLPSLRCPIRQEALDAPGCHSSRQRRCAGNHRAQLAPGRKAVDLRPPVVAGEGRRFHALRLRFGEPHRDRPLSIPRSGKKKLDLSSYQWSPRGDAILLEGENDLWLLDPQTGGLRQADPGWRGERSPGFLSGR